MLNNYWRVNFEKKRKLNTGNIGSHIWLLWSIYYEGSLEGIMIGKSKLFVSTLEDFISTFLRNNHKTKAI